MKEIIIPFGMKSYNIDTGYKESNIYDELEIPARMERVFIKPEFEEKIKEKKSTFQIEENIKNYKHWYNKFTFQKPTIYEIIPIFKGIIISNILIEKIYSDFNLYYVDYIDSSTRTFLISDLQKFANIKYFLISPSEYNLDNVPSGIKLYKSTSYYINYLPETPNFIVDSIFNSYLIKEPVERGYYINDIDSKIYIIRKDEEIKFEEVQSYISYLINEVIKEGSFVNYAKPIKELFPIFGSGVSYWELTGEVGEIEENTFVFNFEIPISTKYLVLGTKQLGNIDTFGEIENSPVLPLSAKKIEDDKILLGISPTFEEQGIYLKLIDKNNNIKHVYIYITPKVVRNLIVN